MLQCHWVHDSYSCCVLLFTFPWDGHHVLLTCCWAKLWSSRVHRLDNVHQHQSAVSPVENTNNCIGVIYCPSPSTVEKQTAVLPIRPRTQPPSDISPFSHCCPDDTRKKEPHKQTQHTSARYPEHHLHRVVPVPDSPPFEPPETSSSSINRHKSMERAQEEMSKKKGCTPAPLSLVHKKGCPRHPSSYCAR